MRGSDGMQESLFMMAKLDDFVPADHPLRAIQGLVNEALGRLNGLFNEIYADTGAKRSEGSGLSLSHCMLAAPWPDPNG